MKRRSLPGRRGGFAAGLACATLALALGLLESQAQPMPNPPERMTYQGFLVDANGVALGNSAPQNYDVIFRIYNSENGTAVENLLWSEQQTVTVDQGYFSVLLGEGAAVGSEPRQALSTLFRGPSASERYVGITVKGIGAEGSNVDIQPRLKLLTSPYAFLAQQAVKLVQDTGADLISSSGNSVVVSGPMTANSFTGVGSNLTDINADNITSGTLASARVASHLTGTRTFSGPVGVGTTAPGSLLSLGTGLANTKLAMYDSSSSYGFGIQPGQFRLHIGGSGDRFSFLNAPDGAEVLTIRGNGRVGVGLEYPEARFHVRTEESLAAFFQSSATIGTWLTLGNTAGGRNWKLISTGTGNGEGAGKLLITHGAGQGVATDPKITIDQASRIGIGTHNPDAPLTVIGGDPRLKIGRTDGRVAEFGRGDLFLYFALNASRHSSAVRVASYDGDSNWDFYSDRDLKKDIEDAEPMLERALQVQVRRYRWVEDEADAKQKLGVIAQEVQPLFPDLVTEMEDPRTKESHLAVGYSDFGLIAIKALQEFKAEHDAELAEIKAELSKLARENQALRDQLNNRDVAAVAP